MGSGTAIPADLVDFLTGGVSVLVGTRDAARRPEATRGVGFVIAPERTRATVYLAERASARALANLADNGEIAVGISRPMDNLTLQLKGRCVHVAQGDAVDRSIPERYHAVFMEQLYLVGFPRTLVKRFAVWPAVAVTFDVRDIFVQTPGPEAGKRLGAA